MITHKITSGGLMNEDGSLVYVDDVTGNLGELVYTKDESTGTYTPVTNTTGYNGDRANVALFLNAFINKVEGIEKLEVVENNPVLVDRFSIKAIVDGHATFELYAFNVVEEALPELYINGDYIYEGSTSRLLKLENGVFVVKTFAESIIDNEPVATNERLLVLNATKNKIEVNTKIVDLLLTNPDNILLGKLQKQYNKVRSLIEGAMYEFYGRGNKVVAQGIIEHLNQNND